MNYLKHMFIVSRVFLFLLFLFVVTRTINSRKL